MSSSFFQYFCILYMLHQPHEITVTKKQSYKLYTQRKSPWYPLDRRQGGPTVSLDILQKICKYLAPPRIPTPDHPAPNPVTIVTTLSWLLTKMKK